MGDFVQDDISLGRSEQRLSVPIEPTQHPLGVDRQAEAVGNGERREAMLLCLCPGGAARRGRANSPEHRAGERVGKSGHEAVQRFIERGGWYRRQDHSLRPRCGAICAFYRAVTPATIPEKTASGRNDPNRRRVSRRPV